MYVILLLNNMYHAHMCITMLLELVRVMFGCSTHTASSSSF